MVYRSVLVVAALSTFAVLGACASGGQTGAGSGVSQDLITREMIDESPYDQASDVIRALRPRWFQRAGPARLGAGGRAEIQVYVDGGHRGGLQSLELIAANSIEQIRFMNPSDATTTYGTGNAAGAIVIVTRRN